MCGRFAQAQNREEYLVYLADEADRDIAYDPEPIGRYNVAPGTKVLLLSDATSSCTSIRCSGVTLQGGGINRHSLTRVSRRRPPAECLNRYGSMAGQSVLQMAGSNGRKKATKNSLTSFTVLTGSPYSWRRSEARRSNAVMKQKVFSS